jgi:hypothetical protein
MNGNTLKCDTLQGAAWMVDATSANNWFVIGANVSQTAYRLYVNGAAYVNGALTVAGALSAQSSNAAIKAFDIGHPDPSKPDKRLRHRCLEGIHHGTYYTYKVTCVAGPNTVALPDWCEFLNGETTVFASPLRHFGTAWGETTGNTLNITANAAGDYNVLVFGIRKDEAHWLTILE